MKFAGSKMMVDVQVQLWIWDRDLTSFMVSKAALDTRSNLRSFFLWTEWSLHGILWLIISLIGFLVAVKYNFSLETTYGFTVLFLGLIFDLATVGAVKGIVQRLRPPHDIKDQMFEGPLFDKFSFPSGHTSRAAMLTVLCLGLCPIPKFTAHLITVFPFLFGASRVFMGRHYLTDVLAGLLLGYGEGILVKCLPFSTTDMLKQIFLTVTDKLM